MGSSQSSEPAAEEAPKAPRAPRYPVSEEEREPEAEEPVREETKQNKNEHAEHMGKQRKELEEVQEAVRRLAEKNEQARDPSSSDNVQDFIEGSRQLREVRDEEEHLMSVKAASFLMDHIETRQEEAREIVEKTTKLKESQEESLRALRQFEIDVSWYFNEDGNLRAVCEAEGSRPRTSLKPLYKEIGSQISQIPRNVKTVAGFITTASRAKNAKLAKNKQANAEVAFININKNITVAIQKATEFLRTCGEKTVEQEFLTAFMTIRADAGPILDGVQRMGEIWKEEVDANWLTSLESELKLVEEHVGLVTEGWKGVKVPEC